MRRALRRAAPLCGWWLGDAWIEPDANGAGSGTGRHRLGGAVDFVVLGLGIGALTVLLGLALRNLAPKARRIRQGQLMLWTEVRRRLAWGRACRAAGRVLALAGGFLCFATLAALFARASDNAGALVVLFASAAALLASAGWALIYARRQPRLVPAVTGLPTPSRPVASMEFATAAPLRRRQAKQGLPMDDLVPSPSPGAPSSLPGVDVSAARAGFSNGAHGGDVEDVSIPLMEPAGLEPEPGEEATTTPAIAASPGPPLSEPQVDGGLGSPNGVPPDDGASDAASDEAPPTEVRPLVESRGRTGIRAGLGVVSPSNRSR